MFCRNAGTVRTTPRLSPSTPNPYPSLKAKQRPKHFPRNKGPPRPCFAAPLSRTRFGLSAAPCPRRAQMGASTTPASLWIPAVGLRRSIARCTFSISTSPGASPSSKGALDFLGVPSFGFCHDFRTSRYPAPKTNTNQVVSDYVEIPRTLSSVDSEEARFRACFSLLLSSKADHWKPLNAILNVWSAPRRESDTLSPGNAITTVETPFGMIGVGICYDMRFPELSMAMRAAGSVLLCFPGAFNMTTGPAHWELLQRARALDNQVFVQPSDASLFSRGPSTFFRFCREFWSEMFALRLRGVEFPNPVCRRCAFSCVSAASVPAILDTWSRPSRFPAGRILKTRFPVARYLPSLSDSAT